MKGEIFIFTGNCWSVVDPEVSISLIGDARFDYSISRTYNAATITLNTRSMNE